MTDAAFSKNERAERLMGRRPEGVPFDQPCELGYWCPVCRVPAFDGETFDERLSWSEYNGFLWCSVCNRDYPSALCVRLDVEPDLGSLVKAGMKAGVDAAIDTFLTSVSDAIEHAKAVR